jgi:hypothetical protein
MLLGHWGQEGVTCLPSMAFSMAGTSAQFHLWFKGRTWAERIINCASSYSHSNCSSDFWCICCDISLYLTLRIPFYFKFFYPFSFPHTFGEVRCLKARHPKTKTILNTWQVLTVDFRFPTWKILWSIYQNSNASWNELHQFQGTWKMGKMLWEHRIWWQYIVLSHLYCQSLSSLVSSGPPSHLRVSIFFTSFLPTSFLPIHFI